MKTHHEFFLWLLFVGFLWISHHGCRGDFNAMVDVSDTVTPEMLAAAVKVVTSAFPVYFMAGYLLIKNWK